MVLVFVLANSLITLGVLRARQESRTPLLQYAQNNCGSIWMLCLYNTYQKGIMKRGLPINLQLRPRLAKGWPI